MQKELERNRTLKPEDMKSIASASGPCLTLSLPSGGSAGASANKALRAAEQALTERRVPSEEIRKLLDPLATILEDEIPRRPEASVGLIVLRSKEVLRLIDVDLPLEESVHVSDHFQIRSALQSLSANELEFYLLALSQNRVRLLKCTPYDSVELPWPKNIPSSLEEWLNTRPPTSPPSSDPGSTAGSFTSATDRDKKDEHLANFYRAVNRGVTELLKDQSMPLILCGVDYELSMYQSINTYATLVEGGVHGSPESLKGGEMHKRALEIAREYAKEPMNKALAIYEKLGGTERVSAKPAEILKAAHEGRIAYLFIGDGSTYEGRFDPDTMKVQNDKPGEDLLNLAALQTISHGGEVWTTAPGSIPEQAPMAAIFRF